MGSENQTHHALETAEVAKPEIMVRPGAREEIEAVVTAMRQWLIATEAICMNCDAVSPVKLSDDPVDLHREPFLRLFVTASGLMRPAGRVLSPRYPLVDGKADGRALSRKPIGQLNHQTEQGIERLPARAAAQADQKTLGPGLAVSSFRPRPGCRRILRGRGLPRPPRRPRSFLSPEGS